MDTTPRSEHCRPSGLQPLDIFILQYQLDKAKEREENRGAEKRRESGREREREGGVGITQKREPKIILISKFDKDLLDFEYKVSVIYSMLVNNPSLIEQEYKNKVIIVD